MIALDPVFRGQRVVVTGHTGFKGSWLCEWLLALGAEVYGLSHRDDYPLFRSLRLDERIHRHHLGDIQNLTSLKSFIEEAQPDFAFHLAAQPLVLESYQNPVETFSTNVMGACHFLEALRGLTKPCVAIAVTSDKCYDNREWTYSYRENDPLGGKDPYSASKGACEIVVHSYRQSYFSPAQSSPVTIASARAGNVIGGGDWAANRIIPDCMRALGEGRTIQVRNPAATRPWQHVLEPLGGYLQLAARVSRCDNAAMLEQLTSGMNFGPHAEANRSVGELVAAITECWPGNWESTPVQSAPHEAGKLALSIDKAMNLLGWAPVWDFKQSVAMTSNWYRSVHEGADPAVVTRDQIEAYAAALLPSKTCN